MPPRNLTCINTDCPATIRFTSVGSLLREFPAHLGQVWRTRTLRDDPRCIHEDASVTPAVGMASDRSLIEVPVPAWVWARRKVGVLRDPFTGMPLDDDPYTGHPVLERFLLPGELTWLPIPMCLDAEFRERIPKFPCLHSHHMSAVTGLHYAALADAMSTMERRHATERTIRCDTRLFWRWWISYRIGSLKKAS